MSILLAIVVYGRLPQFELIEGVAIDDWRALVRGILRLSMDERFMMNRTGAKL